LALRRLWLSVSVTPLDFAVSNPYYDLQRLQEWRERISRLRVLPDMPPPWEARLTHAQWRAALGPDTGLGQQMLEWQVWLRSLSSSERTAYQARYPEPPEWEGFYGFVLHRTPQPPPSVPQDQGQEGYWNALEKYYETTFGGA